MAGDSALPPSTLVSLAVFAVTVGYRLYTAWKVVKLAVTPQGVCVWGIARLQPLIARAAAILDLDRPEEPDADEQPNSEPPAGDLAGARVAAVKLQERLEAGMPMFIIEQAWHNDDLPDKVAWIATRLAAALALEEVAT